MASGRIVVTTGPERGKVFEIETELVHVGRAVENQIVLDDPSLSDHQASILNKNARFAIYRPDEAEVKVDGNDIPAEQWVWLPTDARLQFGLRTTCQFSYDPVVDASDAPNDNATEDDHATASSIDANEPKPRAPKPKTKDDSGDKPKKSRPKSGSAKPRATPTPELNDEPEGKSQDGPGSEKRKKKKRKRQTARFITEQGKSLVELGADGQLPELALDEDAGTKQKSDKPKQSSPSLMYGMLAFSFLATLAMLLIDIAPGQSGAVSKSDARTEVTRFYGGADDKVSLRPFQKRLRSAQLARAQRDFEKERRLYLQVLSELNAEDRDLNIGVTGSLNGDVELKKLIGILISR